MTYFNLDKLQEEYLRKLEACRLAYQERSRILRLLDSTLPENVFDSAAPGKLEVEQAARDAVVDTVEELEALKDEARSEYLKARDFDHLTRTLEDGTVVGFCDVLGDDAYTLRDYTFFKMYKQGTGYFNKYIISRLPEVAAILRTSHLKLYWITVEPSDEEYTLIMGIDPLAVLLEASNYCRDYSWYQSNRMFFDSSLLFRIRGLSSDQGLARRLAMLEIARHYFGKIDFGGAFESFDFDYDKRLEWTDEHTGEYRLVRLLGEPFELDKVLVDTIDEHIN